MDAILEALSSELRRLKAAGVKTVPVSPEALAALRRLAEQAPRSARGAAAAAGPASSLPTTAPGSASGDGRSAVGGAATASALAGAEAAPGAGAGAAPSVTPASRLASASVVTPARGPSGGAVRADTTSGPEPRLGPASDETSPSPSASALPPPPSVVLPTGTKAERMAALRERVFADPVCRERVRPGKKLVVGTGSLEARLFFCGEAPGAEEEIQGEPFVGPAGQLLTRMIQGMGVRREDVYIGNIMNWRPDLPTEQGREQLGNRPPTTGELLYCLPFLRAQIEIVAPDVIIALGSTAAQGLLGAGSFKALGEVRGRWHEFAGRPVMVTYHPSYILRNGSNRSKRAIWEDLLLVMERAGLAISERQRGYFLDRT